MREMWLSKKQKREIVNYAMKLYRSQDYGHGINHLRRTVRLAQVIAKKEGADMEITTFGAILHQFHDPAQVEGFLRSIGVRTDVSRRLVHCVESIDRKGVKHVRTIEAKIVFDADKLQVLGPLGLVRQLTFKVCANGGNYEEGIAEFESYQADIIKNYLQTRTARRMVRGALDLTKYFLNSYRDWFSIGQRAKIPYLD